MKNKILLFSMVIILATSLVVGGCAAPTPAKTYTFTAAAAWEENHPNNAPLFHLIDSVNEKCETKDGKLTLTWVGGPETFKATDLPDACNAGSVDLFHSSCLYYGGVVPESNYTSLPYAWDFDTASGMWNAGINDLVDKAWQKKGIKVLDFASLLGFYFFRTEPFTKLSDFEGKKLRVPGGLFAFLPPYLGAVSTSLASAEVYGAMQRGTIDGGLQPLVSYVKYSYWEVAPYVLDYPLFTSGAWYWVNLEKFNGLPASLQDKLVEIARDEETFAMDFWEENHVQWIETMNAQGANFISLSAEDEREMAEKVLKLKDKIAEQVPPEDSKVLFEIYDRFTK